MKNFIEEMLEYPDYDCGYMNRYGGGNTEWWLDYIRAEIGSCNDYWRSIIESYSEEKTRERKNENG